MNGPVMGMTGILLMLVGLFFLRLPAGFVMALTGFVGIACINSLQAAYGTLEADVWDVFSRYGFTVIPMFILLGEVIYHAGYSDRLYTAAHRWLGHWRGGLAIATIMASAAFSAICGSNTATAATLSAVAIPPMRSFKYHPILISGAVAAGSTLGVMIPPSIVLVVYGLDRGQSIGKLFFGTLIPSAVLALAMIVTVILICKKHPEWSGYADSASWGERVKALPELFDVAVLFGLIMYALFSGKVTTTETAAAAAALGIVFCLIRRRLLWGRFKAAVYDTLRISCMIFMIIMGATVFGHFMTMTRLPYEIAQWIGGLELPSWAILSIMLLFYILGGCIMDALAFLLVSLPIFYPLVESMGYDPIWFGVVICVVTTLGAITPPVGICCYVVAGRARDIPIEQVFRGSFYFIPAYIFTLLILFLFPYWTVLAAASRVK